MTEAPNCMTTVFESLLILILTDVLKRALFSSVVVPYVSNLLSQSARSLDFFVVMLPL